MHRLELRHEASARFWTIALEDKAITVRSGAIGTTGKAHLHQFASAAEALQTYERLIAGQRANGYVERAGRAPAAGTGPRAVWLGAGDVLLGLLGALAVWSLSSQPAAPLAW